LQFKTERNAVVKLIREKKKEYYEDMIDSNKENPMKLSRGKPRGTKDIDNIDFEVVDDINGCNIADKNI